jgi:hypothetical protein
LDDGALAELAAPLVNYVLFADESPVAPGMIGEGPFAADFAVDAKRDSAGRSLRDIDGQTRLLRFRCSYMIYSPAFSGLPKPLRQRTLRDLAAQLDAANSASHRSAEERSTVSKILTETLPEFAEIASARRAAGRAGN